MGTPIRERATAWAVGLLFLACALPARADTWAHDFGGLNSDHPVGIRETPDGGFLIAGDTSFDAHGFSEPGPYWHFWAVRIDASGNLLWHGYYPDGGETRNSGVAPRSDGGWMLTGSRYDFYTRGTDALLLAIDGSGALIYAKQVGGSEVDTIRSIVSTSDGNFVTVGTTASFGAGNLQEVWVMKVAASGDVVWSYRYGAHPSEVSGPRRWEQGIDVEATPDGGTLIGGIISNQDSRSGVMNLDSDVVIEKIDAGGQVVWSRTYGGGDTDQLADLKWTADGGALVLGTTRSASMTTNWQQAWVLRLDGAGAILWQEALTTEKANTAGIALAPSPDGSAAVLLRVIRDVTVAEGVAIVRLGSLGEVQWSRMSLDLSTPGTLARGSNGDYLAGLSVVGPSDRRMDMRVVRILDEASAHDCSGLNQDFVFSGTATTFADANRKVSRHTFTPPVSNASVSAQFPQADLGALCP